MLKKRRSTEPSKYLQYNRSYNENKLIPPLPRSQNNNMKYNETNIKGTNLHKITPINTPTQTDISSPIIYKKISARPRHQHIYKITDHIVRVH